MLTIELASPGWRAWAQCQWQQHHYLHAPIDDRCSVLAYIVRLDDGEDAPVVGALGFGRPEATRCYTGGLTYGGQADVASGRAQYSRWGVLNMARVWLDPKIQRGGKWYVPNAATASIGEALRRVVVDYLAAYPPCFLDEPWKLRQCLSYCDTRLHRGTIYRAAGFKVARTNADGIQTWYTNGIAPLSNYQHDMIRKLACQSLRSRTYRSRRLAGPAPGQCPRSQTAASARGTTRPPSLRPPARPSPAPHGAGKSASARSFS